jgi:hypothetical protein
MPYQSTMPRVCRVCGREFPARPDTAGLYCSHACLAAKHGPIESRLFVTINKLAGLPQHWPEFGECWEWTGRVRTNGYAMIGAGGVRDYAHRWALMLASGAPIPDGFMALHTCDNRRCLRNDETGVYIVNGIVRPRWGHLWLGTVADNSADMVAKGRSANGDRHGSRRHPERVARGNRHWTKSRPDRVASGERGGHAKLTTAQVLEIRARYATGDVSYASLAREYGLKRGSIGDIIRRTNWTHI